MRALKLALWIFFIYIIQNVFCAVISINGIVPDLFLAFVIPYAFFERRFKYTSRVIVICAILAGSGVGRIFPMTVVISGISGIGAYAFYSYFRFLPGIIRTQLITVSASFLMFCALLFLSDAAVSAGLIFSDVLPQVIYTTAVSCFVYWLLSRTMFKNDNEKRFIINERN